jgi:hypothetical protein
LAVHFFDYYFLVHHPVNWDDRYVLALAMTSELSVTWQFPHTKGSKLAPSCEFLGWCVLTTKIFAKMIETNYLAYNACAAVVDVAVVGLVSEFY